MDLSVIAGSAWQIGMIIVDLTSLPDKLSND